jgi:hypothetical protein
VSATGKRIEFLARAIVNRLEDRGLVEFRDAEAGITVVAHLLGENFAAAESLEQEARQRLGPKASSGDIEEEMRRLAAERNFIL